VLFPLVRGIAVCVCVCVCYLSCIVTEAVLILWWLLCFTVSVTSTEDGNSYSPKRRVALCVVTMQQTVTYNLNTTTYMKPCHKSTQFTTDTVFAVNCSGNPLSRQHSPTHLIRFISEGDVSKQRRRHLSVEIPQLQRRV